MTWVFRFWVVMVLKYPEITEGDQEVKEKINVHVLMTITRELKAFQSREETEEDIEGIAHNIVNAFKNYTEEPNLIILNNRI